MADREPTEARSADGHPTVRLAPKTIHVFALDLAQTGANGDQRGNGTRPRRGPQRSPFPQPARRHRDPATEDWLRCILGACTGRDPQSLVIARTAEGQPLLHGQDPMERTCFSLSHSAALMLLAVTRDWPVGVDVEAIRPIPVMSSIAEYYFSPAERRELLSVRSEDRLRAFFNGWTRKEAFVKATGDGMARDFRSFDVTLAPGSAPALSAVRSHGTMEVSDAWEIFAFEPRPGYVAAAVARGGGWRLAFDD